MKLQTLRKIEKICFWVGSILMLSGMIGFFLFSISDCDVAALLSFSVSLASMALLCFGSYVDSVEAKRYWLSFSIEAKMNQK